MTKLPKPKKCRECKETFTPTRMIQPVCHKFECNLAYATKAAKRSALNRKAKERREHRAAKEKMKGWQQWFDECKSLAQRYARLRDLNDGCISCDKGPNWGGQWHGSHFRPAGNFKAVALNLLNIHKGCSECNKWKSGNLITYQDRLIEKIGQEKVGWLKSQTQPYRHSIDYLKKYKRVMTKMCKRLEKRMSFRKLAA